MSSRDLAYQQIRQVVREDDGAPMLLTEATTKACERDQIVRFYLLGKDSSNSHDNLKLSKSWHLQETLGRLRKDGCIQLTSEKPIMIIRKVDEDKAEDKERSGLEEP